MPAWKIGHVRVATGVTTQREFLVIFVSAGNYCAAVTNEMNKIFRIFREIFATLSSSLVFFTVTSHYVSCGWWANSGCPTCSANRLHNSSRFMSELLKTTVHKHLGDRMDTQPVENIIITDFYEGLPYIVIIACSYEDYNTINVWNVWPTIIENWLYSIHVIIKINRVVNHLKCLYFESDCFLINLIRGE